MSDRFDNEIDDEPIPKAYRVFVVIEEYDPDSHGAEEYTEIASICLGYFGSSDEQWNQDEAYELFNAVADDHT